MMTRHFRLNSELSGAIAKKQLYVGVPGSFFNQFVTYTVQYVSKVLAVNLNTSISKPELIMHFLKIA